MLNYGQLNLSSYVNSARAGHASNTQFFPKNDGVAKTNVPVQSTSNAIQTDITTQNSNSKISAKEAFTIVAGSMFDQVKNMALAVVKHPIRTAAAVGVTTAGLMALPFIGIPTAVGGSVLALGYGAFAVGKGAMHAIDCVKNMKQENYAEARNNLQQLGKDTVDIALSVPAAPKAITSVANFAKYGKIGVNSALISQLKSAKGISNKFSAAKAANQELSRSINYQANVDKAISKLPETLDEAKKAQIKKELLDFNVPDDELSQIALDKYAEVTGIKAQPKLEYVEFDKSSVKGMANSAEGKIYVAKKGARKISTKGSNCHDAQRFQLKSKKRVGNDYVYSYLDTKTGKTVSESASRDVVDLSTMMRKNYAECSSQGQRILTTLHEREHIRQYAQMAQVKGTGFISSDPAVQQIYADMIKDMPAITPGSYQAAQTNAFLARSKANGLMLSYIKDPLEIGARDIQIQALKNSTFNTLDKVFKATNKMTPSSTIGTAAMNSARAQSLLSQND